MLFHKPKVNKFFIIVFFVTFAFGDNELPKEPACRLSQDVCQKGAKFNQVYNQELLICLNHEFNI